MRPVIFLVDPNDDHRAMLMTLLGIAGYETAGSATADAAVKRIRLHRPTLIIGEHPTPLSDGRPLCEVLAADPSTRDIPFLALTARAMPEEFEAARAAHPAGVLVKPVSLVRIVEEVLTLIGR